jgi:acyl-CoA thioester hydrolase
MELSQFRHRLSLRVRWAEVDMQGVVFNGHYLTYCDVCVTEYWRALGLRYPDEFKALGADALVRKATLEYHGPALYDDELLVCGRTASFGRTSLRFLIGIFRKDESAPLIEAELVYVNADPAARRAAPWPQPMRERIRAYETVPPEER